MTQKKKVALALKDEARSIKDIQEETDIREPNIRRILGVGAKEGHFERVERGVYRLTKDGKELIYIHVGDAVGILPRLVKDGLKGDMIFLDIPYKTTAVQGGNRGIRYKFITPEQFQVIAEHAIEMLRTDDSCICTPKQNPERGRWLDTHVPWYQRDYLKQV